MSYCAEKDRPTDLIGRPLRDHATGRKANQYVQTRIRECMAQGYPGYDDAEYWCKQLRYQTVPPSETQNRGNHKRARKSKQNYRKV